MRVRQLDLIAFGHFTNRSIDLSQGHYGLHMIYGPNEAGKSSSLRALTSLLFGFPQRTDDNFLHSNKDLRVGATLESRDGKALACVRRKAKTATLLHAESSQE
ncbi:MAG: AAA family ATPase, partial [Planctomycetota bacterium]